MKETIEYPDVNDVDRAFYAYIMQLNKKYDCYLNECHFKLVLNEYQYCPCIPSNLSDNKTMC